MKSTFPPLLARLRARATPVAVLDIDAVIRRSLRDAGLMPAVPASTPSRLDGAVIDGQFQEVDEREGAAPPVRPASATSKDGLFSSGQFSLGSDSREYKLFVPDGTADRRLPLIVMLHGCKQDPDDFARGTRMNQLAQESGALVLYPAQAKRSNGSRCWNWFQAADQRRDAGEPALLAAMTRHILACHLVDPRRVHVAGLSAGGAMAAILGSEYPELYASIGVHSGLPPGAAHDIPSAFAAMKSAAVQSRRLPTTPVIVFHGDRDTTVNPQNGENVLGTSGARTQMKGESGRRYTRTVIRHSDGQVRAEHWLVRGAGHAWSGGSSDGSYADALGPDASREFLRFFSEHPLA